MAKRVYQVWNGSNGSGNKGLPPYKHIQRNEFAYRKHTKQKEADIAICDCQCNQNDQESACGGHCLNVLTSTECTPGYCPCGDDCMNQKFQKCQYAKSVLSKSEGLGWGLLADEDIKAGQFIIEYSGEVITWKEAKQRSQVYEAQGLKDAYIISLNAQETIDATQKGNLARFINHSCSPNCETRKWNVLGEIRVGIFAKQAIPFGTELSYNYNFEWYGGAKVRCLCGSASCSGFLGAKSRGFQEDTYVWEDDDSRYSVENIPLYDSTDDETNSNFANHITSLNKSTIAEAELEGSLRSTYNTDCNMLSQTLPILVEPLSSISKEIYEAKNGGNDFNNYYMQNVLHNHQPKVTLSSRIREKNVFRSHQLSNPFPRSLSHHFNGKSRQFPRRQADIKLICKHLTSKEACAELNTCEELNNQATSQLDCLYEEIRPAIELHEWECQDSVPTSVAEKWIEASCNKLRAKFELNAAIIKTFVFTPQRGWAHASCQVDGGLENRPSA